MASVCRLLIPIVLAAGCAAAWGSPAPPVDEVSPDRLERSVRTLAGFGTRHSGSATDDDKRGIGAARRWIVAELKSIEGLEVTEQSFVAPAGPRLLEETEIVNVVATLRGTSDPDRVYVVSGHYDSRATKAEDAASDAPGANDDASGVAVVLELARLFAKSPPPATIVFLCVAGEEQGLLGAAHFAEEARAANLPIHGMFTNDIVGNSRGRDGKPLAYVRLFTEGPPRTVNPMERKLLASLGAESDSPSRQLARFVREAAKSAVPGFEVKLVFRPDRSLRGGDHLPFLDAGFPAARFTEAFEDYARQHQDVREGFGDLPDFVDIVYLANVCRVNLAALHALACGPRAPPKVRLHAKQLENDTTLSWDPVPGATAYEVVWRETTEADWTRARRVEGTEATLPLSKDDLHFGVRALGEGGGTSPVTYATPWRGD